VRAFAEHRRSELAFLGSTAELAGDAEENHRPLGLAFVGELPRRSR
jgi:hypothetical protein